MASDNGQVEVEDVPPFVDEDEVKRLALQKALDDAGLEMPWTSRELDEADVSVNYLVENVLVESQPAVIAGAYKSLKTSTAIELAVSLATRRQFFGEFWVPQAKRVLMFSAESGKGAIQETARRIVATKNDEFNQFTLSELDVEWGWWVPKASTDTHLILLKGLIEFFGSEVVIFDPLYLSLSGEIQSNLSLAGDQINALAKLCVDMGATPVCLDHVKRSSANAKELKPLELGDITGAGKAEFFRQWIILGRRSVFDPESMLHELWMTVGGNDGHSGSYAVDIDESRADENQRQWIVDVRNASEQRERCKAEQAEAASRRSQEGFNAACDRLWNRWPDSTDALTLREIRIKAGLKTSAAAEEFAEQLVTDGKLSETRKKAANHQTYPAFRRVKKSEETLFNDN